MMDVFIEADGRVQALHSDLIPLPELGRMTTRRVSDIVWSDTRQVWEVIGLKAGQVLFSDRDRSVCLAWEVEYFNNKILKNEEIFG